MYADTEPDFRFGWALGRLDNAELDARIARARCRWAVWGGRVLGRAQKGSIRGEILARREIARIRG
jgi:hypothetical protein